MTEEPKYSRRSKIDHSNLVWQAKLLYPQHGGGAKALPLCCGCANLVFASSDK